MPSMPQDEAIRTVADLCEAVANGCDTLAEDLAQYQQADNLDTLTARRDARRAVIETIDADLSDVLADIGKLIEAGPAMRATLTIAGQVNEQ